MVHAAKEDCMPTSKSFLILIMLLVLALGLTLLEKSESGKQIRIVGSSTVYPFSAAVAERFGQAGLFRTPIVEATGTGGGIKLFCSGAGQETPDIVNASRKIKSSEVEQCKKNGVESITEIQLGFDGIVLATALASKPVDLTKEQLFKALAKKLPKDGVLIDNPYTNWSQISASLPDEKIIVYGPPPTSGTRDAFVELVMEKACEAFPEFAAAYPDEKDRKKQCHLIREDGVYVEAGENDNIIVQKLTSNPVALGIFGFGFLEENASSIRGGSINGVFPTFENILAGKYTVSRSMYMYIKNAHLNHVPGLREFVKEFTSEAAFGPEGYLALQGLIPLAEKQREMARETTNKL